MPQGRDGWKDGIMNDYKDSRKRLEQVRQRNAGEEMGIEGGNGGIESEAVRNAVKSQWLGASCAGQVT